MSKPRNPESEVVKFFLNAEPGLAVTVFRIVRGILDQRGAFKPTVRPVRSVARRAPAVPGVASEAS